MDLMGESKPVANVNSSRIAILKKVGACLFALAGLAASGLAIYYVIRR